LSRLRQRHSDAQRSGFSESWQKLFREAESLLGEDPGSARAPEFCNRWFDQWQSTTGGDSGVPERHKKAWADRANWPPEIQRFVADFDATAVGDFISKVSAVSMKTYYSDRAWARETSLDRAKVVQARKALWSEVRAALDEPPSSKQGRVLARRWLTLSALSTQGGPAIEKGAKRASKDREHWPLTLRQHVDESRLPVAGVRGRRRRGANHIRRLTSNPEVDC
jgi:hypothetical protein